MTTTTTRTSRSRRIDPDVEEAPFIVEDETPAPTRRRRAVKEEEEAPAPKARTRRAAVVEDDDDEEEAPAPKARTRRAAVKTEEEADEEPDGKETVIPIARGRRAIKAARPSEGGNLYFKWGEDGESQVIKFLEDEDGNVAWSYNQHWVTRSGKQSFPCLGDDCPLCDIGAKVSQKIVYTILNLSHPDGPTVQVLEVTPTVDDDLVALDTGKSGPLTRMSWDASRPKKSRPTGFAKYNYTFTPVKDRDLGDDYKIDLDVVDKALNAIIELPAPEKVLGTVTRSSLQEIADEVLGS